MLSEKSQVSSLRIPKYGTQQPLSASTLMTDGGQHHAKLGEYAACLWKEKAMTDVLIVVNSQEFKAHKAVLACYSPYFKEVLVKPGFSDVHYLQLPSVTPRAFEILLEYMYTGNMKVNCQELSEVYRSARRLGMRGALKKCIELLHVTPNNFQNMVYLYMTALKLDLLDSSERAFRLMVTHFERLVMTEEFLDLEKDQVVELLSSDEIGARSEVVIFLAALKWIHHKYLEREEHLYAVLECIRFPLMNMQEVLACFHPPVLPGIIKIPQVRESLLNATCYIAAKSIGQESLFEDLSAKPRTFLLAGEPMLLWDVNIYKEDQFEKNKLVSAASKIQAWTRGCLTRKRLREELSIANHAAVIIQSAFRGYKVRKALRNRAAFIQMHQSSHTDLKEDLDKNTNLLMRNLKVIKNFEVEQPTSVFVMGICDTTKLENGQNSIFSFNMEENSFKFIVRCPVALHRTRIAASSEALYVIGGCNPMNLTKEGKMRPLKECRKYQFIDEKWSFLPFMSHARSLHGAVKFQGSILAIGGKDDSDNFKILSSIEILNESSNEWLEFQPSLPEPLAAMGVAVQDFILWVAGGMKQVEDKVMFSDDVWCYDQRYERWYKRPNLPQPMAFPTLLSTKDRIICIGGTVRSNVDNELTSISNVYSFQEGRWIEQEPMPDAYHEVVACMNEDNIYVFGAFSTLKMSHLENPFYFDSIEKKWKPLTSVLEDSAGFMIAATTN